MALTNFLTPTIITQLANTNNITGKPSIPWANPNLIKSNDVFAVTEGCLYTISGFWSEKFFSETNQLHATGFGFADTHAQVLGIELQLNVQRKARIQDLVIQLMLNGQLIGDNLASTINPVQNNMYTADTTVPLNPVGDFHIYGGGDNLWGTNLTSTNIADPSFGVAISFRSNDTVPHHDQVYLDQVALRITYA